LTDEELYEALNAIIRDVFMDDDITVGPETTADQVAGWDSFNHLNVIVAVERHFGIKLKGSEAAGVKNVGELAKLIRDKTA
jgi:acyl carrier protein